jgi:crotonobetainyl-CoA:carnitine CoA-transferase CaiB-like acyl-CoA transferase
VTTVASAAGANGQLPLVGVRVLDLSRILAGPWACQMLADLGAEVLKIEQVGKGDGSREWGPPFLKDRDGRHTRDSPTYLSANRNKKSVTVNLAAAQGQDIIRRLAAQCDVLVENFKVGDLARYGLDYPRIRDINPAIIYCSITGFGQTGPLARRPGYDPIFQALGGLMSVTGHPDGSPGAGPMKVGPSLTDIIGGLYADVAILSALFKRTTGSDPVGQYIDLAMLDCTMAAMSHIAMQYLVSGFAPVRLGGRGNGGAPGNIYGCADGSIYLSPGNDEQYARLCRTLGREDLGTDERYATQAGRIRHRDELTALLRKETSKWSVAELEHALELSSVPAAPILDLAQAFESEHARARGLRVEVPHAVAGSVSLIANPIRFSETPISDYRAPPAIGEHTDEVLGALLNLDASALALLKRQQVI